MLGRQWSSCLIGSECWKSKQSKTRGHAEVQRAGKEVLKWGWAQGNLKNDNEEEEEDVYKRIHMHMKECMNVRNMHTQSVCGGRERERSGGGERNTTLLHTLLQLNS